MKKGFIAITGASSGIGKTTADTFLKKGYNVLLMARRVDKMQEFASLPNAMVMGVDVVNKPELDNALKLASDKFGDVQAIINTAYPQYASLKLLTLWDGKRRKIPKGFPRISCSIFR